jgi:hypothetical protein
MTCFLYFLFVKRFTVKILYGRRCCEKREKDRSRFDGVKQRLDLADWLDAEGRLRLFFVRRSSSSMSISNRKCRPRNYQELATHIQEEKSSQLLHVQYEFHFIILLWDRVGHLIIKQQPKNQDRPTYDNNNIEQSYIFSYPCYYLPVIYCIPYLITTMTETTTSEDTKTTSPPESKKQKVKHDVVSEEDGFCWYWCCTPSSISNHHRNFVNPTSALSAHE